MIVMLIINILNNHFIYDHWNWMSLETLFDMNCVNQTLFKVCLMIAHKWSFWCIYYTIKSILMSVFVNDIFSNKSLMSYYVEVWLKEQLNTNFISKFMHKCSRWEEKCLWFEQKRESLGLRTKWIYIKSIRIRLKLLIFTFY